MTDSDTLPRWTDVTDAHRKGGTARVWVGRSGFMIHETDMTYVGDSTGSVFDRGERYRVIPDDPYRPADEITVENTDTGERFDVYWADLRHALLNGLFHVHDWKDAAYDV